MMAGLEYLIGGILPYLTAIVLVLALLYRVLQWFTAPQHLPWELFPHPKTFGEQIKELVTEITTLHSIYKNNRKIWFQSLLMHWGLYLLGIWFVLLIFNVQFSYYIGVIGAAAVAVGALLLLVVRITNSELRAISEFVEYFNLLLLLAISTLGLYTNFFGMWFREYLLSLVSFAPKYELVSSPSLLLTLLLVQFFVICLPLSRMAHFVGKYFTYHKVKWGEEE
ncbi:respiratory nitrate reductase subunit gamma [Archaeoglobus veneficus]|nr:respiratory nitrate reductase subunit gamma [Archaeoglobus veneficus]